MDGESVGGKVTIQQKSRGTGESVLLEFFSTNEQMSQTEEFKQQRSLFLYLLHVVAAQW